MKTLLILTCQHDVGIACGLLHRIERLGGWRYFSRLHLHLDHDVTPDDRARLVDAAPAHTPVHVTRADGPVFHRDRRAESMLDVYRAAAGFGSDIVRLDPDIFISSAKFFERVSAPHRGVAGKRMPLYLPARIRGRQLRFIQGGVTCWGADGRSFLQSVSAADVQHLKRNYGSYVQIGKPKWIKRYDHYLCRTEDVLLTGVLAVIAGVKQTNIRKIQVSPYDVLRDHRSDKWTYQDYIEAFERSGALAYHFEGRDSDQRLKMTQLLQTHYQEQERRQHETAAGQQRGRRSLRAALARILQPWPQ